MSLAQPTHSFLCIMLHGAHCRLQMIGVADLSLLPHLHGFEHDVGMSLAQPNHSFLCILCSSRTSAEFIKDLLCRFMCGPMCAETALNKRALKGRTVKKRALGSRFKNGNRLHVCMKFASKSVHSNRTTGFRISWRGQMWDQLNHMKPKSARSYTIIHFQT